MFQIEPAGWETSPEVIELIHRVFDEYGFIWDPEDEFWDLLVEEQAFPYRSPIGGMWVMRDDDGVVVGSIAAERIDGPTVELHRLYLDADLRGARSGTPTVRDRRELGSGTWSVADRVVVGYEVRGRASAV